MILWLNIVLTLIAFILLLIDVFKVGELGIIGDLGLLVLSMIVSIISGLSWFDTYIILENGTKVTLNDAPSIAFLPSIFLIIEIFLFLLYVFTQIYHTIREALKPKQY